MIMGNMTTFIFYKALFPMCTAFSVEKRNGRRRHGQRGRRSIKERIRGKHGPTTTTTTTYTVSSDAGKSRKTFSRHDSSAPPRLALDVSTRRWPSTMNTHTHESVYFLIAFPCKKKKPGGASAKENVPVYSWCRSELKSGQQQNVMRPPLGQSFFFRGCSYGIVSVVC
jgi:hypothetical protein